MFNGTPTQNFPVKTVPSKNNNSNLYIFILLLSLQYHYPINDHFRISQEVTNFHELKSTLSRRLFPAIIPNISTSFTYEIKNEICDSRTAMNPAFCRARVYGLSSCVNSKGRLFADECLLLVYKKANAN